MEKQLDDAEKDAPVGSKSTENAEVRREGPDFASTPFFDTRALGYILILAGAFVCAGSQKYDLSPGYGDVINIGRVSDREIWAIIGAALFISGNVIASVSGLRADIQTALQKARNELRVLRVAPKEHDSGQSGITAQDTP
jgi:hypothetical protein